MTRPRLTLMLPGTWHKVLLQESDADEQLALLATEVSDLEGLVKARVRALTSTSADMLLLRTGTSEPTVVLTAWPDDVGPVDVDIDLPDRLVAALGARLADPAEVLTHPAGDALIRSTVTADAGTSGWTYWLAHAQSGRVLLVEVTVAADPVDPEDVARYDRVMQLVHWDEPTSE